MLQNAGQIKMSAFGGGHVIKDIENMNLTCNFSDFRFLRAWI